MCSSSHSRYSYNASLITTCACQTSTHSFCDSLAHPLQVAELTAERNETAKQLEETQTAHATLKTEYLEVLAIVDQLTAAIPPPQIF